MTSEANRVAGLFRWLDDARRDFRYAVRSLSRSPAFTVAAVLTLSVGIGATTAIASIVNTILLQPLPFPSSDRLVRVVENFTGAIGEPGRVFQRGVTHQELLEWQRRTTTLDDATALIPMAQRMVRTSHGTAGLWGAMIAGNTFAVLGASTLLGRTLGPSDETTPDVVVLSFETWRRHFHGDTGIVGRAIELRSGGFPAPPAPARLLTVVGVLRPDFAFQVAGPLDFYTPIALDPSRPSPQVTMIAHLKPGVSLPAAAEEANLIGAAICPPRRANAPPLPGPRFEVLGVKDQIVQPLRPALRVLLATVGVVLLIVCANVANLLLARGTARQREMAVRLAIGASRGRIVRQILAECAVLAFAGGLVGAALSAAGVLLVKQLAIVEAPGILRLIFGTTILPRAHEVGVDLRLASIAFGLSAVTCVIFGVLPALQLSRANHLAATGSRGGGTSRNETKIRGALVVGQLVMATMLLVGAGLLAHSFVKLSTIEKGWDASNVLTFQLLFPDQYSISQKAETIEALLARMRAAPNVQAAGFARHGILIKEQLIIGTFVPPGRTLGDMREEPRPPRVRSVSAGFLTAMSVPVVEGRELDASDGPIALPAIVINRSVARQYFGGERAVGQVVDWHVGNSSTQVTVVGVVEDVRNESLAAELYPEIFVDYRQLLALYEKWGEPLPRRNERAIGLLSFALRTRNDPVSAVPMVREIVNAVDPAIGIDSMVPMSRMVANSLARQRFYAVMLGVFAAVAALLAAIGIYGVLAYTVVQRTQEIGIRIALGAERSRVLLLVLRQGLTLTAVGVALGLAGAAAGSRYLQGMLFGIAPLDAWTYAVVGIVFSLVAAGACYVPARRATTVEPVVALRYD